MRIGTRNPGSSWPLVRVAKRERNPEEGVLAARQGRDEDEEDSEGGAKLPRG